MESLDNKSRSMWNRTFICCVIINIFFCFAHQFTTPLMSTYAGFLGATSALVGLLAGLFYGIAFALRPVTGPITTFGNKKVLLIASYVLGVIVNLMYAMFNTIPLFVAARVLQGIQYGIVGSLAMAIASAALPKEKIGSGIGIYSVAGVFGTALGPSIGLALRNWGDANMGVGGGFRLVFLASTICCGLALIPSFMVKTPPAMTKEQRQAMGAWYKNIVSLAAVPSSVILCLYSMAGVLFSNFLVPYAATYGIEGVSLYFTVSAVVSLVTRPFAGKILDKKGPAPLFFIGTPLFILAFLCVGFGNSLAMVLLAAVLQATGWGSLMPTVQAMAMASVPMEKGGVASNTSYLFMDLGFFLGPTLGGFVYAFSGSYRVMFISGLVPIIIGFVFFVFTLLRGKKKAA